MRLSIGDEAWRRIDTLGSRIDADLRNSDVRLTQGGEPTYISASDHDAPEWNTTAVGDSKRKVAESLRHALAERFAPVGLLHDGQGRWYPGEALPRWSLDIFWRRDGRALWSQRSTVADSRTEYHYGLDEARALADTIATQSAIDSQFVVAAFEDPWPLLHETNRLPIDVDPLKHDLSDPAVRARLARLVYGDFARPAGFVLPLRAGRPKEERWVSARWPLVRDRLYLLPGSSPQGYRLPLDTLPTSADADLVRTALCVEHRDGRLYVFMPPFDNPDDYLALLEIVERSAAGNGVQVRIEGHDPPVDSRLTVLRITPDPGVIEINLHPASSWTELCSITETLDQEARRLGLTTVKHWFDGRPVATGGGNHVTLGGPSLPESPFVRRPDLLRSLVTYWQHHPALSYLFSGIFVGPTSQAPRIDEARDDLLEELEIAFQELDAVTAGGVKGIDPQMMDGMFKHLLVDVTGNTHRAEFCVDKLFPPDLPARQLGVLELRAFEMPPDWRTGMLHLLLVRALVARFWKTPYRATFRRWADALHDRFMLPYFLEADLRRVLEDLKGNGYDFSVDWFEPYFEFRFPLIGRVKCGSLDLELRHALEPWLALGEQAASGASSRSVDSSLERIQVLLRGTGHSKQRILCNGRELPLQPTDGRDGVVGAVRFRAWTLNEMLHPTIRAQVPLTFELVDADRGAVVASCRYQVGPPDGKDYGQRPLDAEEAEARRTERFEVISATSPRAVPVHHTVEGSGAITLDLRRPPP